MNRIFILTATTLLICVGAFAQDAPPVDGGPKVLMLQRNTAGPVGPVTAGGMFFSAEVPDNGKAITGQPYTATASTEVTQVLADGNRIINKTTASVARDSLGRTRREETMGMVGPWQVNGPKLVFISDPTSQTNYVLDESKQVASLIKLPANLPPPPPLPPPGAQPGVNIGYSTMGGTGVTVTARGPVGDQPEDVKTESLGVQTMEGVSVEGKRTTRTIPAGQIGNEEPIETVSEVWYSPDLQVVVMSKHSDPRFGETTYQLTGIQRDEPDHSLFEVPPGYTLKNMPSPISQTIGSADGAPVQIGIVGAAGPIEK